MMATGKVFSVWYTARVLSSGNSLIWLYEIWIRGSQDTGTGREMNNHHPVIDDSQMDSSERLSQQQRVQCNNFGPAFREEHFLPQLLCICLDGSQNL